MALLEAGVCCWRSVDLVLRSLRSLLTLEPVSRRVLFRGLARGSVRTEGESRLGSEGEAGEADTSTLGSSLASRGRSRDSPSQLSCFRRSPLDFLDLALGELGGCWLSRLPESSPLHLEAGLWAAFCAGLGICSESVSRLEAETSTDSGEAALVLVAVGAERGGSASTEARFWKVTGAALVLVSKEQELVSTGVRLTW